MRLLPTERNHKTIGTSNIKVDFRTSQYYTPRSKLGSTPSTAYIFIPESIQSALKMCFHRRCTCAISDLALLCRLAGYKVVSCAAQTSHLYNSRLRYNHFVVACYSNFCVWLESVNQIDEIIAQRADCIFNSVPFIQKLKRNHLG